MGNLGRAANRQSNARTRQQRGAGLLPVSELTEAVLAPSRFRYPSLAGGFDNPDVPDSRRLNVFVDPANLATAHILLHFCRRCKVYFVRGSVQDFWQVYSAPA